MNWYCKNMENLIFMVGVVFMFLMIVDLIWGRKEGMKEGKWPLFVGLAPAVICLLGLITALSVWSVGREIFAVIISPSSSSVWLGWVYAAKTILAFLLVTPLLAILGIVFTVRAFLPHTWIFK